MEGHRDEEEDGTQPYKKRSGERRREGRSAGQPSQFRPSFHLPSLPPCSPPPASPTIPFNPLSSPLLPPSAACPGKGVGERNLEEGGREEEEEEEWERGKKVFTCSSRRNKEEERNSELGEGGRWWVFKLPSRRRRLGTTVQKEMVPKGEEGGTR